MGKTSKFFKSLFGFKSPETTASPPPDSNKHPKRRWSFIKPHRDKPQHHHHISALSSSCDPTISGPRATPLHRHHRSCDDVHGGDENTGSSNHAIAVAAATAAVAEAAVAAAQAAAEVVRMTSRTAGASSGYGLRAEWAAVKIQSHFRAYLARRALRALRALVKLQALVRGHILRKHMMRRLQALIRAQARARAGRFHISDLHHLTAKGPPTPEKFEHVVRARSVKHDTPSAMKNNGSKLYSRSLTCAIDDEKYEKVLEIDTTKPHVTQLRRRSLFQTDPISYSHSQSLTTSHGSTGLLPSPTESFEVNSQNTPFKFSAHDLEEEVSLYTAQNSPPFYSVSSKGIASMRIGLGPGPSPFTPAKSDGSRSCLSGYSDHPNYMSYTESSRAKVRSMSAPRHRPLFDVPGPTKMYSVYGLGPGPHRGSNLHDSFTSKAYPGSGRLDRLGMPVGGLGFRESEFSGGYWN